MAHKENPKQVVHLPLVPVRAVKEASNARHRCGFIRICLYSYSGIVTDAEKVIHDFEALISCGVVHGRYIHHRSIFSRRVVLQEGDYGEDTGGRDVYSELVFPNRELLDVFGQAGE